MATFAAKCAWARRGFAKRESMRVMECVWYQRCGKQKARRLEFCRAFKRLSVCSPLWDR